MITSHPPAAIKIYSIYSDYKDRELRNIYERVTPNR